MVVDVNTRNAFKLANLALTADEDQKKEEPHKANHDDKSDSKGSSQSNQLHEQSARILSDPTGKESRAANEYYASLTRKTTGSESVLVNIESFQKPQPASEAETKILGDRIAEGALKAAEDMKRNHTPLELGSDSVIFEVDSKFREDFTLSVDKQLAIELKAQLTMRKKDGTSVEAAAQRLIAAFHGKPPIKNFESMVARAVAYNRRQEVGNQEAKRRRLKDDHGDPLRFTYMTAKQIAKMLDKAADTKERFDRGEATGAAAKLTKAEFNWALRDCIATGLDPEANNDQAQLGTCGNNSQNLAGWKRYGDRMMTGCCNMLLKGKHRGERFSIEQLAGRGGSGYIGGQAPGNYLPNQYDNQYLYGRKVGLDGFTGGVGFDTGGEALGAFLGNGHSALDIPGAFPQTECGGNHATLLVTKVLKSGRVVLQECNSWGSHYGLAEPYEGIVKNNIAQLELRELKKGT